MNNEWHLYVMATLYIVAGLLHFIKPRIYLRIMPRYLPNHRLLVYLSGIIEIILGSLLLFEKTQLLSCYLIIAMLAAFLLVHFYMLKGEKEAAGFPKWLLILRIPIQFLLMYWAYIYT